MGNLIPASKDFATAQPQCTCEMDCRSLCCQALATHDVQRTGGRTTSARHVPMELGVNEVEEWWLMCGSLSYETSSTKRRVLQGVLHCQKTF